MTFHCNSFPAREHAVGRSGKVFEKVQACQTLVFKKCPSKNDSRSGAVLNSIQNFHLGPRRWFERRFQAHADGVFTS